MAERLEDEQLDRGSRDRMVPCLRSGGRGAPCRTTDLSLGFGETGRIDRDPPSRREFPEKT